MWRRSCRSSWWSSSSPVVSRVFVPLACYDFRPAQLTDYRPGSTSMLQRRTWGWALCKRHAKLIQVLENALQRASHRASAIPVARTWATPEASASRFWPAPAAAHRMLLFDTIYIYAASAQFLSQVYAAQWKD